MKKIFILCVMLAASITHAGTNSFSPEIQFPYTLVRPVLYKLYLTYPQSESPVIINAPDELTISELVKIADDTLSTVEKSHLEKTKPITLAGFFFHYKRITKEYFLKGNEVLFTTKITYPFSGLKFQGVLIVLVPCATVCFLVWIKKKKKANNA